MILNLIHSTFGYCYPHYACRKEIMNCFMLKQPFFNLMNPSAETKKAPVKGATQDIQQYSTIEVELKIFHASAAITANFPQR